MKPSEEPHEQEPTGKHHTAGIEKNASATTPYDGKALALNESGDNQDTPPVTKSGGSAG
ncbi:MAG: hypothetical protein ACJ76N_18575 [Thermoanaerobaculia bacterium]